MTDRRDQIAGAEALRWAYRIILGREASAAEIRSYEEGRHSIAELRAILLSSKEYRKKSRK